MPLETEAGAIVLGCFEGLATSQAHFNAVDAAFHGALVRLVQREGFKGKLNECVSIPAPAGLLTDCVVLVGLGKEEEWCAKHANQSGGTAALKLASAETGKVAFFFPEDHAGHAVSGVLTGCVGQDLHRKKKKTHPFSELLWASAGDAAETGRSLGEGVNLTRRLVNEPAAVIYPESFAAECATIGERSGFDVEVWDERRLKEERCGSLIGVAQGSARPPRLVIMRYRGGDEDKAPLCLVGKGVTFDSGGLSLKPSEGMRDMKCDMAGAATVLGAMQAIADLKLPVNVTGLVGLVENMVSGTSYKLGDVLTARSGVTIEVLNTDAEGRLVLADVLDVAVKDEAADRVVDLATLTGACVVALGVDITGVMTNNEPWCQQVKEAAAAVGERIWELPMDEEFDEHIKSSVADIKNIGNGRWGGAITAAKLLERFVGDTPWVHLDIAGPAFADKPKSWIDAGASGCMVRTLVELASRG